MALLAYAAPARAESCRFSGSTNHDGRIVVRTDVTERDGLLTVDVALSISASVLLYGVQVLTEEISTWRNAELQSVAVNGRTVVDGTIKRQQWDVFVRDAGGLQARRVQAKRLEDFVRRHPGFVGHWSLAGFGQPWLTDYAGAAPEVRPDLSLPASAIPRGLRSPLALAFYWSRFLPPDGGSAPLFLPGFKHDARADIAFAPAIAGEGWRRWVAPLRHPGLEDGSASTAAVWVSPDHYLMQLAFDVHAHLGTGRALLRTEGCQGLQVAPVPAY